MIVKIFQNSGIKNRIWLIFQNVKISSKRHKVGFELRCDILPDAPCTNAVSSAVMTMPVLILQDLIDVILIIGAQTESAELTIALIINIFVANIFARYFHVVIWVQFYKQIRE
jgi:hypothetical protein